MAQSFDIVVMSVKQIAVNGKSRIIGFLSGKIISKYPIMTLFSKLVNGKTEITECIPQNRPFKCKKDGD